MATYVDEFGFTCQDTPLVHTPPTVEGAEGGAPICPCGWGPNGTPTPNIRGVYEATQPPFWTYAPNTISGVIPGYITNTHPLCMTWFEYTFPYTLPPMHPCWQDYLQMPFCLDIVNGTSSPNFAEDPNQLGYAQCRLASDLRAMTNQQRKDIFDNTCSHMPLDPCVLGTHMGSTAQIPVFLMTDWQMPQGVPNQFPPHQNGGYATPAMRIFHITSNGTLATHTCFISQLSCPNVCIGCTAYTSTNCTSTPGACDAFDPQASLFWQQRPVNIPHPTCCIDGCTNPLYIQYNPFATCDDGSCTTPIPSWDCISPGNCQDPGTGLGQYQTLAACQVDCPFPPSWDCISPGNCQDPGTGQGQYSTLAACIIACPALSWNCIPCVPGTGGHCIDPGNGTGTYSSLNNCLDNCPSPPASWDCTNPGTSSNCHDPGCGQGQYNTLSACQNSCITPMPVSSGACGCNF